MTRIRLRIPDSDTPYELSLSRGAAILLGREPSLRRLDPSLQAELRDLALQIVKLRSLRISANHLLLRLSGDSVKVCDLGSRNGTWLRLPPAHTMSLPSGGELTFELAGQGGGTVPLVGLRDVEWSAESEYAPAIVKSISDWMKSRGMHAEMFTTSGGDGDDRDADEDTFALADGSRLHVRQPYQSTFEVPWQALLDRIRNHVNEQNLRFEQLQGHEEDFVLVSPAMREVHRQIVDASLYGMRLMLLGPTGAGKERLARCYHAHSRQHRGPYATINCALLKENLLYAQLFGAKKGSYTGAVRDVVGVVEAAQEGTLFLDEVGEMDLEVQKALLRFLDSRGEYLRLGETQPRQANVQIVCATNLALDDPAERRAKFRDDLWYRLAVKVVQVPPLSERPEDIIAFLRTRHLRGGKILAIDALSKDAVEKVLADPWPGNFRDLENFVERLPATAAPGTLDATACTLALNEGRRPKSEISSRSVPNRASGGALSGGDWVRIAGVASKAFEEDHGLVPVNWAQTQIYMEKYFKPVFIAHSCQLAELNELNKSINYSELARRLNVADGSTIKLHLTRYIERFRKGMRSPAA